MTLPHGVLQAVEAIREIKRVIDPEEYDYSSTQLDLPKGAAREVLSYGLAIPDEELMIEDDCKGRETEPHITVLYGIDTYDKNDVMYAVGDQEPITVVLGNLSFFDAEKYDVLIIEVDGDQLHSLYRKLNKELETSGKTFKEYTPHITIAYLKKGEGKKYKGKQLFSGRKITFSELTFSSKNGKCEYIPFE